MDHSDSVHAKEGDAGRRSFLVRLGAVFCGAIVALFPFAVGWGVLVDPWRRSGRRADKDNAPSPESFVRICPLDALAAGGTPQAFPVVKDVVDGWTHALNQRVGMVFLERGTGDNKSDITALSAKCPHLGCIVDFNRESGEFECPCHKSAFAKNGDKLYGPSLRGLDMLPVELRTVDGQQEVFVAFQKFKPGIPAMEPV